MIVDLERNDLSRVCEPGSVRWPELMAQRELAGVTHLVSTVEGRLRDGVGLAEILAATFPGGSVTGAPKIAALDLIAALEPVGRGASMGALGDAPAGRRLRPRADDPHVRDRRRAARTSGSAAASCGTPTRRPRSRSRGSRRGRCSRRSAGSWPRMKLLAVAVAGRGLVDPDEPVFGAGDEALLRGRAAFETTRVYGGRPFRLAEHVARLAASAASLALPAPDPDECARLAALAVEARRDAARRRRCASTGPGRRSSRRSRAIPPELEERRARGHPARLARARRRRLAARLAAARREVDELRGQHGGRGRGAPPRRRRRRLPRRRRRSCSRRRSRTSGGAAATRCCTPAARGRRARRRHARDAARARAGRRLRASRRARSRSTTSRGADEAFTSSSIREVVPAVELDGARSATARRARPPPRSSAALRELAGSASRIRAAQAGYAPRMEEKVRLGGMALSNGVLVHGPTSWACAVRTADGELKVVAERKRLIGSSVAHAAAPRPGAARRVVRVPAAR